MSDDELSPEEQDLVLELSSLAADPSADRRDSIMQAVRAARQVAAPRATWRLRRRVLAAVTVAALLLIVSTVGALAASSQALPSSPTYGLRVAGEQCRLAIASPVGREELRIQFARDRFRQAQDVVRENRSVAKRLIGDGRDYLDQTRRDLGALPSGEQGEVQNQLNQAGEDEKAAQGQLNQVGDQSRTPAGMTDQ
jgi:hypothetical protein